MSKQRYKGKGMSPAKKKFINRSLLAISIGVSTYIFAQMTDILLVQGLFFVLIAFYEIVMQDVLGVGLIFIKQGMWRVIPGILCIMFYITGYVGIYAVPTAMGVFLLFIDQQQVKAEVTQAEYDIQMRILELDLESMEAYNLQMKTEAGTGYGRRSEKVSEEQNKLRESLAAGLEEFRRISKERTRVSVDVFESLSETFSSIREVSSTTIKLVMFLTIFFGMYVGLIVTHEEFGFGAPGQEDAGEEEGNLGRERFMTFKIKAFKDPEELRDKTSEELQNKTSREEGTLPGTFGRSSESYKETSLGSSKSYKSYQETFLETPKVLTQEVSGPEETFPEEETSLTFPEEETFPESSPATQPAQPTQPARPASKAQSEWERFVRASIRGSGVLNSPRKVNMMTGIPLDRCNEYRRRLEEMKIDGELVVETVQGGSRVRFDRDVILERVREAEKRAIEIIAARQ